MSTKKNQIQTVLASLAAAAVLAASPAWAGAGQPGHGHGAAMGQGPVTQNQGHMMGGHGMGAQGAGGHHGAAVDIGGPGKAADVSRTIDIVMQDNYYEPEEISVTAGETVRFKIVNKGSFLHEFGLGTAAMHAAHQKEMVVMMEHGMIEADRINHERMKMDHGPSMAPMAHGHGAESGSVLVEPGKSAELIWTFPKDATLEFACNIPGHYESGMMGPIKIK
jgi:uncharacterized cupredoxin-like copper-binding protein